MQTNSADRLPCAALFQRSVSLDTDGSVTVCCHDANMRLETGNLAATAAGGTSLRALVEGRHVNAMRLAHVTGGAERLPVCGGCDNSCYGRAEARDVWIFLLAQTSPATVARALAIHPYLGSYLGHPANLAVDLLEGRNALPMTRRSARNLAWMHFGLRRWSPAERAVLDRYLPRDARDPGRRPSPARPAHPWRWVLEPVDGALTPVVVHIEHLELAATAADRRAALWRQLGGGFSGFEFVQLTPLSPEGQRDYRVAPGQPPGFRTWIRGPEGRLRTSLGLPHTLALAFEPLDGAHRRACLLPLDPPDGQPRDVTNLTVHVLGDVGPGAYRVTALLLDAAGGLLAERALPVPLSLSTPPPAELEGAADAAPTTPSKPRPSGAEPPLHIRSMNVNLVGYCNLSCVMCAYTGAEHGKSPRRISRRAFRQILRTAAREQVRIDVMLLSWKGEALLHPELEGILDDLGDESLAELVWQYELVTNGQFMRRAVTDRILEGMAGGEFEFSRIQFSIDADNPDTYARVRVGGNFEDVERRVRHFIARRAELGLVKPYVSVELIPQRLNVDRIEPFIRRWLAFFAEHGITPAVEADHDCDSDAIFLKPLDFWRAEMDEDPAAWARMTREAVRRVLGS